MIFLTYPLSESTPAYGNSAGPEILSDKQMCCGDSCNTLKLSFSNHHGTHLDCPLHFDPEGKSLTDFPPDYYFCTEVELIDCPLEPAQILDAAFLSSRISKGNKNQNAQAVILKTGWSDRRNTRDYMLQPPGFHANLAEFLRVEYPDIRFFGFDVISLSSFTNRVMGRESHKAFLAHENPIMILEDLNLKPLESIEIMDNLLIAPLWIDKADGAPCTVMANLHG